RRHTRSKRDWSSDVCSSDLKVCVVPHIFKIALCFDIHRFMNIYIYTVRKQLCNIICVEFTRGVKIRLQEYEVLLDGGLQLQMFCRPLVCRSLDDRPVGSEP